MVKILKINRINNCGHFKHFAWPEDLQNFEKVNVFYGPNGSGKSSFSGAFEAPTDQDLEDRREIEFTVSDESGGQKVISSHHDTDFLERILIYSDRYVEKGHSFRLDPTLDSVLTVGKRSVEEEKRLQQLFQDIEACQTLYEDAEANQQSTKRRIEGIYRSISDSVVTAISAAGGDWKSKNAYNFRKVEKLLEKDDPKWVELSDEQKDSKVSLVNTPMINAVDVPAFNLPDTQHVLVDLKYLLLKSPVSTILDTLEKHPEASTWVQDGIELHHETEICIFCGGPISEDRKKEIANHFSDEVEKLQTDIQSAIDRLVLAKTQASDVLSNLPDSRLLIDHLRDQYNKSIQAVKLKLREFKDVLDKNIEIAERKLNNVLMVIDDDLFKPPAVDFSEIHSLISENNNLARDHDRLVQDAAKAVEGHYLRINFQKIDKLKQELNKYSTVVADSKSELERLKREQRDLENREADPLPAAETMTARVSEILGRKELKFRISEDRKHYQVTRNGDAAVGLSTGERSIIMLVYFLEEVANYTGSGKPIVIIDDPVSSMDSNSFMGISTYIWSKLINQNVADQLFLLTHNFELFRQWDIQLDSAKKFVASGIYEIISEHRKGDDGISHRHPILRSWPPSNSSRKKVRSTYHHMFLAVAEAKIALEKNDSLDNRLDAQLLFPNVIRRLLETFLAFRDPFDVGDFTGSMRNAQNLLDVSNYKGDPDTLRLKLTRYTHAYSHSDVPESNVTIQPGEVRTAMAAVFAFINALDPIHFRGMCKVLNLRGEKLLRGDKKN